MRLIVLGIWGLLASASLVSACGGGETERDTPETSVGGAAGDREEDRPNAAGRAEGGVGAAPDDTSVDPCAHLALRYVEKPASGTCTPLPCPCSLGMPDVPFCTLSIDCDEACAPLTTRLTRLCFRGACSRDEDCSESSSCLVAPGAKVGTCKNFASGCDTDADCEKSESCVLTEVGGRCAGRRTYDACNDDEDCERGDCLRAEGSLFGYCTDGKQHGPCDGDDCQDPGEAPPLVDPCAPFAIEYGPRSEASLCPELDCDCTLAQPGVPLCARSIDCEKACGAINRGLANSCILLACYRDEDCPTLTKRCLFGPGARIGMCANETFDCYTDADCEEPEACVVTDEQGIRRCSPRLSSYPCNDDDDCESGNCVPQADTFVGLCTDGGVGSACAIDADCRSGLRCAGASCTDGEPGRP
jgi:hypothetical protein